MTIDNKLTRIFLTLLSTIVFAVSFFGMVGTAEAEHESRKINKNEGVGKSLSVRFSNGRLSASDIEKLNTIVAELAVVGSELNLIACGSGNHLIYLVLPQCSDGIDNDGDGFIDYGFDPLINDPGCESELDNSELDGLQLTQCSDGIDNDGDGFIDYPEDPQCESLIDDDESDISLPECSDGKDNDGDGLIDYDPDPLLGDPECLSSLDDSEDDNKHRQLVAQCMDRLDNDGDGLIDYPWDPGCESVIDNDERDTGVTQCSDLKDNDDDGFTDYPFDPGCKSAADNDETDSSKKPQCSDGIDNDGDLLIDFPEDKGCLSAADNSETGGGATGGSGGGAAAAGNTATPGGGGGVLPVCSDGIDNDGDGLKDYDPDPLLGDPGCSSPFGNSEVSFTHYIIGAWGACLGVDTDTGQGGTQTRTVDSFESSISPAEEEEPPSTQICSLPADFDFLSSPNGDIGNIYNSFVTFIGNQQKKFASPVQIAINSVFENHPDLTALTFTVIGVSPALPTGTDYSFSINPLTQSNFASGTRFDINVMRTDPGLYVITIEVTGGGLVKQATVNLNVKISNPTFEEI